MAWGVLMDKSIMNDAVPSMVSVRRRARESMDEVRSCKELGQLERVLGFGFSCCFRANFFAVL